MSNFPLEAIQELLQKQSPALDGWLIYDFKGKNQLANGLLKIQGFQHLSRRFYYWIPARGTPIKIHHFIEKESFDKLPGTPFIYSSWQEMLAILETQLKGKKNIAMEYSPMNEIPTLSLVDAGTVDLIRSLKISVHSSWPFLEPFTSILSPVQIELHKEASQAIIKAIKSAQNFIQDSSQLGKEITELTVQKQIHANMTSQGYITNCLPIVAVNEHTAMPHYGPTEDKCSPIRKGDFVLFDVWYKKDLPHAPYADHAQCYLLKETVDPEIQRIYTIVWRAQQQALQFLEEKITNGQPVSGFEVDDVARGYIKQLGFGNNFLHRTGHNIFTDVHGSGVNLDNFETHDTRRLLPNTCYSVEPGIYLPGSFGIRLECNVIIHADSIEIEWGLPPEKLPYAY